MQDLFFKIFISKDMKIKSQEAFVNYGICAKAFKLLAWYISIPIYVKMPLVGDYASMQMLKAIEDNVIQTFDSNDMVQYG